MAFLKLVATRRTSKEWAGKIIFFLKNCLEGIFIAKIDCFAFVVCLKKSSYEDLLL
jgi:hypothetical protein